MDMVVPEWPHNTTRIPPILPRAAVTHPRHLREAATRHPQEEASRHRVTRHPNIRGSPIDRILLLPYVPVEILVAVICT